MEIRVILAFGFSLVVLIAWQYFFPAIPPIAKTSEISMEQVPVSKPVNKDAIHSVEESQRGTFPEHEPREIKEFLLENTSLSVTISNEIGGGIKRVVLKNFFETTRKEKNKVLFEYGEAGPLFRVFQDESSCFKRSPNIDRPKQNVIRLTYFCEAEERVYVEYELVKSYFLETKISFSKKSSFSGKEIWIGFPAQINSTIKNAWKEDRKVEFSRKDEGVERVDLKGAQLSGLLTESPVDWVAFGDRYFFMGLLATNDLKPIISVTNFSQKDDKNEFLLWAKYLFPKEDQQKDLMFKSFLGPKDRSLLQGFGTMDQVIDFGIFKVIAVPIWYFLLFVYNTIVSNFGIAIIILTILVRLLFLPLTLRGMGSMQAMQKLQPQLKKIREKYKDDKQKLNQEMVHLLRAHKVNPLGGCFPILIQIPVFISLYQVLGNTAELYHAGFMLWINDLSDKDPYYVLPILLGISFLIQQKLTPSTVDPQTQKIMMFMPIVFTIFMLNLPAGLNLYIFVSTLLGITQQLFVNRKLSYST